MTQHFFQSLTLRYVFIFISILLLTELLPTKVESAPNIERSEAEYELPDVHLIRQDGQKVSSIKEFADERMLLVNFIYTSCTTICPMMSHVFAQAQKKLGADAAKVHFVSISIDPENDNPKVLIDYAKKFKGEPGWDFYTGSFEESVALQKAFGAFRGDKMNHALILFIRPKPGSAWIKFEGFINTNNLVQEIRNHLAVNTPARF